MNINKLSLLISFIICFLLLPFTNVNALEITKKSGVANFTKIAVGFNHTVALKADGSVWTWGNNKFGQLGDGTNIDRNIPIKVIGIDHVKSIAAGGDSSIALTEDGSVWEWGSGIYYEVTNQIISNGSKPFLKINSEKFKVVDIVAGGGHFLALGSDGNVYSWGENNYGELGIDKKWPNEIAFPEKVKGLNEVIGISAGENHSIALKEDGTVWVWGDNNKGQLGIYDSKDILVPIKIEGISDVKKVFAGSENTFFIKKDGSLWFCGSTNNDLMNGKNVNKTIFPEKISEISNVLEVAATDTGTLILKPDGSVWLWREGFLSLYKDFLDKNAETDLVEIKELQDIKAIARGSMHMIALNESGNVYSWGDNTYGQLGNGAPTITETPSEVTGITDIVDISASFFYSAAVKKDGTVWVWGGIPNKNVRNTNIIASPVAQKIDGLTDVKKVAVGAQYLFALKNDGTVWGFGDNSNGELCDAYSSFSNSMIKIKGLSNITSISTSNWGYTLALDSSGSIWEWGKVRDLNNAQVVLPNKINGLTDVIMINSTGYGGVALKKDGTVYEWSSINDKSPSQIEGLADIQLISSAEEYTIAIKKDGTLWMYDRDREITYEIEGAGSIKYISAAENLDFKPYISLLMNDGTICDLKQSSTLNLIGMYYVKGLKRFPVKDIENVRMVSSSGKHTLVLKNDGTVWAYGWNIFGQLGNNLSPSTVLTPIEVVSNLIELQIDNNIMKINGVDSEIDPGMSTSPKIIEDTTFIPIRSLIEVLGGNVNWDDKQNKISINFKTKKIDLFIDSKIAMIDGTEVILNTPCRIINNRTMVPLRFVIENLGFTVIWDSDSQKIEICY